LLVHPGVDPLLTNKAADHRVGFGLGKIKVVQANCLLNEFDGVVV